MKKLFNLVVFLTVIGVDRLTKYWALKTLSYAALPICYGFNLVLTWNRGISWSMFATDGSAGFWILTSFIILTNALFGTYTLWRAQNGLSVTYEMLVLAGGISNVIDRFYYGAVLDFIEWYVGVWHWPVFNIADSMVVLGVFGIITRTWWGTDAKYI